MQEFWFYIKLGLTHVLDFGAYDHILFLAALAIPFTFKHWKRVVILATIFTIAHCTSLALSVYELFTVDAVIIETLIPITILLTALFNFIYIIKEALQVGLWLHIATTAFFGLIHGFGFSNYFKMLMAEEEDKFTPLLGFATGIEIAQVTIILFVLAIAYFILDVLRIKRPIYIALASILIIIITIPLLATTLVS